ncbi:MAG: translocation/assembly module TamB [Paraprevotella sp.]|nr:translocation/assembly module TamB [Paraprevotella sp.]
METLLHTQLTIGKVDFGYFNRIILDDVDLKDQAGKDLLKATRLSAKMELLHILQGKISISNIQIYGFEMDFYQKTETEKPNFNFLLQAFSGHSDKPANPNLRINSVLIRRGKIAWNQQYKPYTPGRFNTSHLILDKVSATVALKCYTQDTLNVNVKKLGFEEHSGFVLKQLAFKLTANRQSAELKDFVVELPRSRLAFQPIVLDYADSDNAPVGKGKYEKLSFQGRISEGKLTLPDLVPFCPPLKQTGKFTNLHPLYIDAHVDGNLKHIRVDRLSIRTNDRSITLKVPLNIGLPDKSSPLMINADIQELNINRIGMAQLSEWLQNQQRKEASYLLAIGSLQTAGHISYRPQYIEGQFDLKTDAGALVVSGNLTHKNRIKADVRTTGLMLGTIIGNEDHLGTAAFDLSCNGYLHQDGYPAISVKGDILQLGYDHYEYHDIALDMNYKKGTFDGFIGINDPNIVFSALGTFNILSSSPYIKAKMSIDHFNPHALLMTSRHEGKTFRAEVQADFSGKDIEDIKGIVNLTDFQMSTDKENYVIGPVTVKSRTEDGRRRITLHSDFLHAEMEGSFKFGTLIAHSKKMLHRYIPTFVKEPGLKSDHTDEVALYMDINSTEPLEKIFDIPLQMEGQGNINGYFNSRTDAFDFNASIPSLTYNGQQLRHIDLIAGHVQDSIACVLSFQKQIGNAPVDFNLQARAAQDNVYTGLTWMNHAAKIYRGSLSADTRFTQNEEKKMLTDIDIHPSSIIVNDSVWNVHASHIHAAPGIASIRRFMIEQNDRHLILDGNMSAHEKDSLTADLKDINLEYIFNIIDFHPVDFTGLATGHVYATNLMKSPSIEAFLHIQNFTFNGGYLGTTELKGGWGKEQNAIYIHSNSTDPTHNSTTQVDGNVKLGAPPRGGIDLMIRTENIDLSFLNRYTEGIFTDLQGRGSGWTRVFGPFKGINIEGDMLVSEGHTKINATGVEYRLLNDSVILRPDNIYFRNAVIYDRKGTPGNQGHYAVVNGVLRHTNLSNMRYDFNIDAHNILGYDVKDFGDNVFCGTAYATGRVTFRGQPGNLNVDINATPEGNTLFTYNLSSPTTLTDHQFITYKTCKDSTDDHHSSAPLAAQSEPESDIRINFHLNLTPEATMKILMDPKSGDYISLNGHGNIRANYYNKGDFDMYGTYTIDHGLYKLSLQDVIRKDFIFKSGGTITFGCVPTQADLNLQAVYTVPSVSLNDLSARSTFSQNNVRVNCLMNIGGKAQSPQISFDFDLPNVNEDEKQMVRSLISTEEEKNMQVIYLLGIGRFYTYDYSNSEQSQSSVAMKSLLSSTLSGQLNQMLSSLLGNNSNWNIGTNLSTGDTGWSDMDVEGLLSGRLLNNRLLINGNFGYRDNNATSSSNFIGDFDLQWLLTKNGNVSLKAYSKTNDRYFTKTSLTTQGIGIGLKRDFNTWKNIFRTFIPKKNRSDK